MLKFIYAEGDSAQAERILRDVRAIAPVDDMRQPGAAQARGDILLLVLSGRTMKDAQATTALYQALDQFQHVIPIMIEPVRLPNIISNLVTVDYTAGADLPALRERIAFLQSPGAPRPLRVLTPKTRRSNWTVASIFIALSGAMFCIGILAIGGGVSRPPEDEYNAVGTAIQGTVDVEIEVALQDYMLFLPRSTEQAANYEATLRIVPTRYRPFMAQTATGIAVRTERALGTPPATATPSPTPAS